MRETVKVEDLNPGDVIDLELESFGSAVVTRVDEGHVGVFRPYGTTADFTYSGNRVIPYVGIEQFTLTGKTVIRTQKADPKK